MLKSDSEETESCCLKEDEVEMNLVKRLASIIGVGARCVVSSFPGGGLVCLFEWTGIGLQSSQLLRHLN